MTVATLAELVSQERTAGASDSEIVRAAQRSHASSRRSDGSESVDKLEDRRIWPSPAGTGEGR